MSFDIGMGTCVVGGEPASVQYPLLPGSPSFCSHHHNARDGAKWGIDLSGPDDFDIPIEDYPESTWEPNYPDKDDISLADRQLALAEDNSPVWIAKDKRELSLKTMESGHLANAKAMLDRRIEGYASLPYTMALRDAMAAEIERRTAMSLEAALMDVQG